MSKRFGVSVKGAATGFTVRARVRKQFSHRDWKDICYNYKHSLPFDYSRLLWTKRLIFTEVVKFARDLDITYQKTVALFLFRESNKGPSLDAVLLMD